MKTTLFLLKKHWPTLGQWNMAVSARCFWARFPYSSETLREEVLPIPLDTAASSCGFWNGNSHHVISRGDLWGQNWHTEDGKAQKDQEDLCLKICQNMMRMTEWQSNLELFSKVKRHNLTTQIRRDAFGQPRPNLQRLNYLLQTYFLQKRFQDMKRTKVVPPQNMPLGILILSRLVRNKRLGKNLWCPPYLPA